MSLSNINVQRQSQLCDMAGRVPNKLHERVELAPSKRQILIGQLRHALAQAESPRCDVAEFEVGDTDFCFEFDDE